MDYIIVNKDNIETEHICCAISNNNDVQVSSKKSWLKNRFDDGLVFLKSTERGKCFIEYIPAEKAWNPIDAKDYMYINCLWVSGSFKQNGYAKELLSYCIKDSMEKGKIGLCILTSKKKKPFLSDPGFLKHFNFIKADESTNGIELWYLPFEKDQITPKFLEIAKDPHIDKEGYVLYYTYQCPFNAKYVPQLKEIALSRGVKFEAIHLDSLEDARNAPTPITTYALFYNGKYLTNEQMNDKRFLKLLDLD